MPVDYDLVVLGGTLAGRMAAIKAVNVGARVALVEPPGLFDQRQQQRYLLQALQQLGEAAQGQRVVQCFQPGMKNSAKAAQWDWQTIVAGSAIASQAQNPELSPAAMSASGIDVVLEMPERLSRQLTVTTATRRLQARGILAAFGTVPLPIADDGSGLSPSPIGIAPLLKTSTLPESISIWGDSAEAVMWAEALCAMGARVQLVSDCFLPYEDWDIRRLVRSHLTAIGINLVSSSEGLSEGLSERLSKDSDLDRPDANQNALRLGQGQPALVLPKFVYHPIEKYPDVDTQRRYQSSAQEHSRTYLFANKRLQTRHPRVFACGSLLSSFPIHEAVAQAEAFTAVRNALFLPTRQMRYHAIPEGFYRFARVGLTPRFARKGERPDSGKRGNRNTGDWAVWTASSANSTDLSRMMPLPLYCKLIGYQGRLQSIHLLGAGAGELIKPLAKLIGQPIETLMQGSEGLPVMGLADVVSVAVERAVRSRWQPGHWRRDWAENWFNWRRSR